MNLADVVGLFFSGVIFGAGLMAWYVTETDARHERREQAERKSA